MKNGKILLLITMLVLSLGIGSAQAGTFANGPFPAGSVLASEIFGTGSNLNTFPAGGALAKVTAVYTMAATPGAGAWALVNFTLTNATFSTAVVPGDLVYSVPASVTIVQTAGGTSGSSTVQFRVDWVAPGAVGDTLTLTYDLKGLNGSTVALGISMTQAGDPVDSAGSINVFTVSNGSTEAVSTVSVAAGTFIDVAQDRKQFIIGGVNNFDSIIGDFTFTDNGPLQPGSVAAQPAPLDAWTFANLGAGGYAGATGTDVTLTLTGDFNASIAAPGNIYIVPVAGVNINATTVTPTTAVFTLPAARVALGDFTGTNVIRMAVDGVTAIDEGAATVAGTVNFRTTNGTYLNDSFSGTLYDLRNNGSTCFLYNIPSSSNAGARAYVRIINDSTVNGRIRATLTLNDGTAYTDVLVPELPAGQTVVLNSGEIATNLGAPDFGNGRARLVINGEIPSMVCQGTISQTTNGQVINTNFSSVAP